MKAIVFAAGKGTRLKPFTDHHPKALAPFGNTTALGIVLERLARAGADRIVVNVHHFADQVVEWLNTRNYSADIIVSDESAMLLDTGGALVKIFREHMLGNPADDEPIMVHNADIITDFPIREMARALDGADAVILADPCRDTSRKFLFDRNSWLKGWINSTTGAVRPSGIETGDFSPAAFDGVHCMTRHMLEKISYYCGPIHPFSITDCYIDACTQTDMVRRYTPTQSFRWYDIGTPDRLLTAQQAYNNGLLKL